MMALPTIGMLFTLLKLSASFESAVMTPETRVRPLPPPFCRDPRRSEPRGEGRSARNACCDRGNVGGRTVHGRHRTVSASRTGRVCTRRGRCPLIGGSRQITRREPPQPKQHKYSEPDAAEPYTFVFSHKNYVFNFLISPLQVI